MAAKSQATSKVPVGVMKVEIRKPKIKGYKKLHNPRPEHHVRRGKAESAVRRFHLFQRLQYLIKSSQDEQQPRDVERYENPSHAWQPAVGRGPALLARFLPPLPRWPYPVAVHGRGDYELVQDSGGVVPICPASTLTGRPRPAKP